MIVHEASHVLVAVALGVPFSKISLGFYGVNPAVALPSWFAGIPRDVVNYAGGILTGSALLAVYILCWSRKYRKVRSPNNWFLGLLILGLAGWEFANGLLEGKYHTVYLAQANQVVSPASALMFIYALAATLLHLLLRPWETAANKSSNTDA